MSTGIELYTSGMTIIRKYLASYILQDSKPYNAVCDTSSILQFLEQDRSEYGNTKKIKAKNIDMFVLLNLLFGLTTLLRYIDCILK